MNQLDVRILKSRDQDPRIISDRRERTYTFQRSRVPISSQAFPWGDVREARESAPAGGEMCQLAHCVRRRGRQLTSIFRSSMALASLRTSRRAAMAEYSMSKGRPVLPSLYSLMALLALVLGSFWKAGSGGGQRRVRDCIAHLLELGEEPGHSGGGRVRRKSVGWVLIGEGTDDMVDFRLAPPSVGLAMEKSARCHQDLVSSSPCATVSYRLLLAWPLYILRLPASTCQRNLPSPFIYDSNPVVNMGSSRPAHPCLLHNRCIRFLHFGLFSACSASRTNAEVCAALPG